MHAPALGGGGAEEEGGVARGDTGEMPGVARARAQQIARLVTFGRREAL